MLPPTATVQSLTARRDNIAISNHRHASLEQTTATHLFLAWKQKTLAADKI
jgi:hypothetical protein